MYKPLLNSPPRLGAHMSISGGLVKALYRGKSVGCETIAIFSASPRVWQRGKISSSDADEFLQLQNILDIYPVILHSLYLANLATPSDFNFHRSIDALIDEFHFCNKLKIPWIVMHPGSHRGTDLGEGIRRIAKALDIIFERVSESNTGIAMETTVGGGSMIGYRFQHLRDIIGLSNHSDRLSVCMDTCHIFAAGYNIDSPKAWNSMIEEFDSIIGLDKLTVIHLNDSQNQLGSNVDRHTHIGKGQIGLNGFQAIVNDSRMNEIPMLLETPKDNAGEWDRKNLNCLRSLWKKRI